ncbi:MAG: BamA/TamA family outer membrane protein [Planctomycetota bacterium]
MPATRFSASVLANVASLVAVLLLFGNADLACAQGGGMNSSPAARPPAAADTRPRRSTGGLSEFATDEVVAGIRVKGNATVPDSRITGQMQTRVGRPFDPKTLSADVRKLAALPYFVSVRPLTESTPQGRVVILEIAERQTIRWVKYLGNERIRDKKLKEETGLEVGGAVDPYAVEEGRRRIAELYRSNGFTRVVVEVLEGHQPGDKGVTYVIHEGEKQRIWSVAFEGNQWATDGQLKSKVQSKPSPLRLWGGKLNPEQVQADVVAITGYYRKFGFFRADVGRIIDYNDDGSWARVKFIIDEGPRYEVRQVALMGVEKFDNNEVVAGMELGAGAQFEYSVQQADVARLKALYGSRGHVFAKIEAETVFLEEPGKVDLIYTVDEGDRFRVGNIYVQINGEASHTRIQTALNRLSIFPGDIIDTREVGASERRLRSATIFNTNPTQGGVPKISYRPQQSVNTQVATEPTRRATYKPIVDPFAASEARRPHAPPAYQVAQRTQPTQQPQRHVAFAPPTPPQYGGVAVGSVSPAYAPAAAPNSAQPGSGYASQAVYAAPTGYEAAAATPAVQPVQFAQLPGFPPPGGGTLPPPSPTRVVPEAIPPAPVNTQLFPSQQFQPITSNLPPDPAVDVFVNLEETQTGRFVVGASVNSDAGVLGQIMLDERNFDWRRVPTSMQDFYNGTAFRGGGQRFRLEATPGTEVQRYLASWQQPYLFDSPISLSLSGSYFDRRFEDWDEQRLGGRVALGYQWVQRDLNAQLTYRGENVNIVDTIDDTLPEYAEMLGDNTLHGFGIRLINDTRDSPFLATEGYYLDLRLEQVVGSFTYARAEFEGKTYFLLRERPDHTGRHVMVLQTRLGFTGSNTPSYDRFYAGGIGFRGFDFRGASPVRTTVGNLTAEIGGDFMWLNTAEYMFPITADDMINGVVFCDFGTVEESVEIEDFRVAPGVGLRIQVPAMGPAPIALDFAWPIADADTDERQVFTFNVGFLR